LYLILAPSQGRAPKNLLRAWCTLFLTGSMSNNFLRRPHLVVAELGELGGGNVILSNEGSAFSIKIDQRNRRFSRLVTNAVQQI